jgi:hypothetical protein
VVPGFGRKRDEQEHRQDHTARNDDGKPDWDCMQQLMDMTLHKADFNIAMLGELWP